MSTAAIDEIAPDLFRLSIYVPGFDMQFNHFLVCDEEPLLFHAGLRGMFPTLREAVAKIVDPAKLRHIAWSHFESDEIGALNDWLQVAPQAQPVCTLVGKLVSADDFSIRPARGMTPEDVLTTGKYRYRFYCSPHIPHGWDAGLLFEETRKTLFCLDLFHHFGNVEPVTACPFWMPPSSGITRAGSRTWPPAPGHRGGRSGCGSEESDRSSRRAWPVRRARDRPPGATTPVFGPVARFDVL